MYVDVRYYFHHLVGGFKISFLSGRESLEMIFGNSVLNVGQQADKIQDPNQCLTRAGHNSMLIFTPPFESMQTKNRRRFGTLWVLWHALGTLFGTLWHKEWKKARNESPIVGLRVESYSVWGTFWGAFCHILLKIDVFLSDVFQIGFFIDFGALRDPPGPQKTSKTIVLLHENKVLQKW